MYSIYFICRFWLYDSKMIYIYRYRYRYIYIYIELYRYRLDRSFILSSLDAIDITKASCSVAPRRQPSSTASRPSAAARGWWRAPRRAITRRRLGFGRWGVRGGVGWLGALGILRIFTWKWSSEDDVIKCAKFYDQWMGFLNMGILYLPGLLRRIEP